MQFMVSSKVIIEPEGEIVYDYLKTKVFFLRTKKP